MRRNRTGCSGCRDHSANRPARHPQRSAQMAKDEMSEPLKTEVLVCVSCRAGQDVDADGVRPGARLFDALSHAPIAEGVTVRGVECLSNCDHGCSVAVRGGAARWTYVYGNFDADAHVDILREGIAKYQATDNGLVPWRERPEHFRKNCIARIPPLET